MSLGQLSLPKSQWKKLAYALEQRLAGQQSLWEEEPEIEKEADTIMKQYQ